MSKKNDARRGVALKNLEEQIKTDTKMLAKCRADKEEDRIKLYESRLVKKEQERKTLIERLPTDFK